MNEPPLFQDLVSSALSELLDRDDQSDSTVSRKGAGNPGSAKLHQPLPRDEWAILLSLHDCQIVSEEDRNYHWSILNRRSELQAESLTRCLKRIGLLQFRPPLPAIITLFHSGRLMTDLDHAFRFLRLHIARWLSLDDESDPRVSWECIQRPSHTSWYQRTPCTYIVIQGKHQ
jgi:hypothetical protein